MKKKMLEGIEQEVITETLDNGLKIFLMPFKNRKNYSINYMTIFGAAIDKFKVNGKVCTPPSGVAHFLEHKMFEQETGEDPFEFFSKTGSDANASTGYKSTSYTVEGTNNIEENLEFLLNYVNSPYFTDENVEKEKNIIVEEINMYNDEPESRMYNESSKAIFKRHSMRIDIGGTEESVRKITKDDLYSCYNAFYIPSNMYLFISGNFDAESILKVIKNNKLLNEKKNNPVVSVIRPNEPLEVNKKKIELKLDNVVKPKMIFTLKISLKDLHFEDKYKFVLLTTFIYDILYGSASIFKEEALSDNLFTEFVASKMVIDDFLLIEFMAESSSSEKLKEKIVEYFNNKEITKDDVERYKKTYISSYVLSSDRVQSTLNGVIESVVDYGDVIYDKINIIRGITLDDVLLAKSKIDIDNSSLVVAYSKK